MRKKKNKVAKLTEQQYLDYVKKLKYGGDLPNANKLSGEPVPSDCGGQKQDGNKN